MKRILFICLAALFSIYQSFAATFNVGEYGYDLGVDDEGQYAIWCGHAGRYSTLDIPAEVIYAGRTFPVKMVILGRVDHGIFYLTIPSSVVKITDATPETSTLLSIHVDEANPVYTSVNDKCLIEKKTNKLIKACIDVDIPEGISEIGPYAFYKTMITSICIPATVKSMGEGAFGYSQLVDIKFEEGSAITSLPERAFYISEHITHIDIPESVTEIGPSAFEGCHALDNVIIPNGVTRIENSTFYECVSLSSIKMPSVTEIGSSAFEGCRSMKRVQLYNVQTIETSAFANCYRLYTVCLPKTLENINEHAFYNSSSINRILMEGDVPPSMNGDEIFSKVTQQVAATLYVPVGSKTTYKAASVWGDFANIEETDTYNGITNVKANTSKTACYDLQGRKFMNEPNKGIYIKNGKKVVK
ncbi:MAG: leucine-rich repeat domain-containing protein [Paraprevotella sp.]|nr:leucine-rich repeat domain-containing protein [Paraprevotella sp.]